MSLIWHIFMSHGFRWFMFFSVMILNFIAYYQDPTRYTMKPQCYFRTPCKWFTYVAGLGAFTMDVLTFIGLWYTISPLWMRNNMPDYWYIPFIVLGYAIISQITIDSPVYQDNEDALNRPPQYLWPQRWRVVLYATIMIFDICIFTQMYIDSGINDYSKNFRVFDFLVRGRFGGWSKGNYVQFLFSWMALCGVIIDIMALRYTYMFNACDYGLPISWNF